MNTTPAEVVFALSADSNEIIEDGIELYQYSNGPVKVPGPWKRGRPKMTVTKSNENKKFDVSKVLEVRHFEFVNASIYSKGINKASRARVHRHFKLNSRFLKTSELSNPARKLGEQNLQSKGNECRALRVPLNFDQSQEHGVDPFQQTTIKLEPYMHDLLFHFTNSIWKRFYALESMTGRNPVAEYWMPRAFQDSALMHSFIGCAEAYFTGYSSICAGSRGLKHLQATISIINRRLTTDKAIATTEILPVIAGIALLEQGAGRHENWRIHMHGLKQLVELSGGMRSLCADQIMLDKIHRADILGSLYGSEHPYFSSSISLLHGPSYPAVIQSSGFTALGHLLNLAPTLRKCIYLFEHTAMFWTVCDHAHNNTLMLTEKPTAKEAANVRHIMTTIQYTLLSERLQKEICAADHWKILEYCRHTLILYSLSVMNEVPSSPFFRERVCENFLASTTHLGLPSGEAGEEIIFSLPIDFHLWATLLAANVVMPTSLSLKDLLYSRFSDFVCRDGSTELNWNDLQVRMSRYLWISGIHEPIFHQLWLEIGMGQDQNPLSQL